MIAPREPARSRSARKASPSHKPGLPAISRSIRIPQVFPRYRKAAVSSLSGLAGCTWTAAVTLLSCKSPPLPAAQARRRSIIRRRPIRATTPRSGAISRSRIDVHRQPVRRLRLHADSRQRPFSSAGGTGTFTVNSGAGCAWTATSGAPWIRILSGQSGSGSGQVRSPWIRMPGMPAPGPSRRRARRSR